MAPSRSRAHLAFVRTLPCCVCGRTRGVEAAHASGSRGMGQKCSDLDTMPLCRLHHEEQHRIGWPRFIQVYELDVPAILAELRERPKIVVASGIVSLAPGPHFVALYREQEFVLKPTSFGLELSVACALSSCGEYLRDQLLQRRAS